MTKPHHIAVAAAFGTRTDGSTARSVATKTHTTFNRRTHDRPPSSRPSFKPARVIARQHTLVLTGELDRASAHLLEAELDRLCEEEVTGITLDLRGLSHIDSIGVAVITLRCSLCQRRGYEIALIPGPRFIHGAFRQAGVVDMLPFRADAGTSVDGPPWRADAALAAVPSNERQSA